MSMTFEESESFFLDSVNRLQVTGSRCDRHLDRPGGAESPRSPSGSDTHERLTARAASLQSRHVLTLTTEARQRSHTGGKLEI